MRPPAPRPRWRHINHLAADGRSRPGPVLLRAARRATAAWSRSAATCALMSALQQRLVNAQQIAGARLLAGCATSRCATACCSRLSSEAVLILDADARSACVEANPAARDDVRRRGRASSSGLGLLPDASPTSADAVQALSATRCAPATRADDVRRVRPARTAAARSCVRGHRCSARTTRRCSWCASRRRMRSPPRRRCRDVKTKLLRAVESAPDGFVVTDDDGEHHHRQRRLPRDGAACRRGRGARPAARPLGRRVAASTSTVLIANLRQRGVGAVLRHHPARRGRRQRAGRDLRRRGPTTAASPSFGFAIRNVGPRLRGATPAAARACRARSSS